MIVVDVFVCVWLLVRCISAIYLCLDIICTSNHFSDYSCQSNQLSIPFYLPHSIQNRTPYYLTKSKQNSMSFKANSRILIFSVYLNNVKTTFLDDQIGNSPKIERERELDLNQNHSKLELISVRTYFSQNLFQFGTYFSQNNFNLEHSAFQNIAN